MNIALFYGRPAAIVTFFSLGAELNFRLNKNNRRGLNLNRRNLSV